MPDHVTDKPEADAHDSRPVQEITADESKYEARELATSEIKVDANDSSTAEGTQGDGMDVDVDSTEPRHVEDGGHHANVTCTQPTATRSDSGGGPAEGSKKSSENSHDDNAMDTTESSEQSPTRPLTATPAPVTKAVVAYIYEKEYAAFSFGKAHPLKPMRTAMAHSLIMNYDMGRSRNVRLIMKKPTRLTAEEMMRYHSDEYVLHLKRMSRGIFDPPVGVPESTQHSFTTYSEADLGESVFDFCSLMAGSSVTAARMINNAECDVAVNWMGGFPHARCQEAHGTSFVNDVVLACLKLLERHQRVMYVDLSYHHCRGVEEAFYTTDRVCTLSLHAHGPGVFPGTGSPRDVGGARGKHFSVNVALKKGVSSENYERVFAEVFAAAHAKFRPSVIVVGCGLDALAGDRLGTFNISDICIANCVKLCMDCQQKLVEEVYKDAPTKPVNKVVLVGGGGYKLKNVPKGWARIMSVCVDEYLDPTLPYNDYYEYFGPDYLLAVPPSNVDDTNTPEDIAEYIECASATVSKMWEHMGPAYKPPDELQPFSPAKKISGTMVKPHQAGPNGLRPPGTANGSAPSHSLNRAGIPGLGSTTGGLSMKVGKRPSKNDIQCNEELELE